MPSDFSNRMNALSKKMSKVTVESAKESFKPRETTTFGYKHKRKYDKQYSQHAFGVSERVALAVKFDLDPWTLKRWKI